MGIKEISDSGEMRYILHILHVMYCISKLMSFSFLYSFRLPVCFKV